MAAGKGGGGHVHVITAAMPNAETSNADVCGEGGGSGGGGGVSCAPACTTF